MKTQAKILFIALFITFLYGDSFGQFSRRDSQTTAKQPKNFEHIGCGIRYPFPGRFTQSTSIGYSPYQKLGEGMINRFVADTGTYDIGCIELDDPPRKMKKDELLSVLNADTKSYLADSSEYISLSTSNIKGREIYEFKTKSDNLRRIKYILEGNRVLIFLAGSNDVSGIEKALKLFDSVEYFSVKENAEKIMKAAVQKSLPQSPTVKLPQNNVAQNYLKGSVKSVRIEAEDVPVLVGTAERKIRSDETYDKDGNPRKN